MTRVAQCMRSVGVVFLCVMLAMSTMGARARKAEPQNTPKAAKPAAAPKPAPKPRPEMSTICIEAGTGLIIEESNSDIPRPPASMVKMMMFVLVSEGLRAGKWRLDTPITVTKHSQGMGGTQVYLKENEVWTLDQLMQAVSVHSANDAAMAVAEGLWGGEEAYKKCMNERAVQLGMKDSMFFSVHGLPPAHGQEPDRTTARDMARIGQVCVRDPQILKWTSQKEIQFRPGEAVKANTNKLLTQMEGCDGVKTGYIANAGFCITASAVRDNIRLIAVVMGSDRNRDRFAIAKEILEAGFAKVCRRKIIAKGDPVGDPVRVANCDVPQVSLAAADDLWAIVKVDDVDKIKLTPQEPAKLEAPVKAGRTIGEVVAEINGTKLGSVALLTPVDLEKASWSWKLRRGVRGR